MKHDLTTGTWQDDTGSPISIVLAATSDVKKTIAQTSAWRLRGHPHNARPKRFKCFKKLKKKMVSEEIQDKMIKHIITKKLPSYLMPAFFAAFKVGCCVEDKLRRFLRPLQRAPRFLAHQDAFLGDPVV